MGNQQSGNAPPNTGIFGGLASSQPVQPIQTVQTVEPAHTVQTVQPLHTVQTLLPNELVNNTVTNTDSTNTAKDLIIVPDAAISTNVTNNVTAINRPIDQLSIQNTKAEIEHRIRRKATKHSIDRNCMSIGLSNHGIVANQKTVDDIIDTSIKCLKSNLQEEEYEHFSDYSFCQDVSFTNMAILFLLILIIYFMWIRCEQK